MCTDTITMGLMAAHDWPQAESEGNPPISKESVLILLHPPLRCPNKYLNYVSTV